jgi:integrase
VHALLSTMLNDAVTEGLLLTNPCRATELPQAPTYEGVFLSPAELEVLVEAIDPLYRCLVLTAAGTGMRWGELTGLRLNRLDEPATSGYEPRDETTHVERGTLTWINGPNLGALPGHHPPNPGHFR